MASLVRCITGALLVVLPCGCIGEATTAAVSKPAKVMVPDLRRGREAPELAAAYRGFRRRRRPRGSWSFESAIASDGATYDDASPWGDMARKIAQAHPHAAVLSQPLHCAAEEIARFYLQKNALPAEGLQRLHRHTHCGSTVASVSPIVWHGTAPRSMTDEQLAPKAAEGIAGLLDGKLAAGHAAIGTGAARDENRVSVVVVVGEDLARFEPGPRSVDANRRVTLRGSARGEFASITALVNQGQVDADRCSPQPGVAPPAFAFECALAPGDSFAWVEVLGQRRGRILQQTVGEVPA